MIDCIDDPVSNIRLCVVALLPNLYQMLSLPKDRKLQIAIDNVFSKLEMIEKDVDVKDILRTKLKEIRNFGTINKQDDIAEQKIKEAEEDKIYKGTGVILRVPKTSQGGMYEFFGLEHSPINFGTLFLSFT